MPSADRFCAHLRFDVAFVLLLIPRLRLNVPAALVDLDTLPSRIASELSQRSSDPFACWSWRKQKCQSTTVVSKQPGWSWPRRSWRCGYVGLACRFPREDRVEEGWMEATETATASLSVFRVTPHWRPSDCSDGNPPRVAPCCFLLRQLHHVGL